MTTFDTIDRAAQALAEVRRDTDRLATAANGAMRTLADLAEAGTLSRGDLRVARDLLDALTAVHGPKYAGLYREAVLADPTPGLPADWILPVARLAPGVHPDAPAIVELDTATGQARVVRTYPSGGGGTAPVWTALKRRATALTRAGQHSVRVFVVTTNYTPGYGRSYSISPDRDACVVMDAPMTSLNALAALPGY